MDGQRTVTTAGRVVVLGGTGSVGRQVCSAFARHGWDVLAVARRPAPHLRDHPFVALDVTASSPARLAALVTDHRADAVVNAAGGWGDTVEEMTYSHLRLVDRLLAGLAVARPRPRLVHVGSVHEYGPAAAGVLLTETACERPVTPYAQAKLATSRKVLAAAARGEVDAVVLRAANMVGPHPPQESFPAALCARIAAAHATGAPVELTVADDRRDFVDVRDVAEAVVLAAGFAVRGGLLLNIGSGEAVPVGDVVAALLEASGTGEDLVRRTQTPIHSKGGGWTRLDIVRAREVLGWRPRITLRDAVRDMWRLRA